MTWGAIDSLDQDSSNFVGGFGVTSGRPGNFAVQNAQRVAGQAAQRVLVEDLAVLLEVGHQGVAVGRARLIGAQRIELQVT